MHWMMLHPKMTLEHLGFIPSFLDERDARPAKEQLDENYRHGGGWRPIIGFTLDKATGILTYPDDPPLHPLAMSRLHNEVLIFYEASLLLIVDERDGTWEVARLD